MNHYLQLSTIGLAILLFFGCGRGGPEIVPVSGQVLIEGKPLGHGSIQFTPEGSRPSYGNLDAEGKFSLTCRDPGDGAVVGNHRVTIEGKEVLSSTDTRTRLRWHAPKKYADATMSGLTQDVSDTTGDLVIDLNWEGGQPFEETIVSEVESPEHMKIQSH